jgi:hypothetical protein
MLTPPLDCLLSSNPSKDLTFDSRFLKTKKKLFQRKDQPNE